MKTRLTAGFLCASWSFPCEKLPQICLYLSYDHILHYLCISDTREYIMLMSVKYSIAQNSSREHGAVSCKHTSDFEDS